MNTQYRANELLKELQNLKKLEPILKAAAEGKAIQVRTSNGKWHDVISLLFNDDADRYRIKPVVANYKRYLVQEEDGRVSVSIINFHDYRQDTPFILEKKSYFIRWIDQDWIEEEV